MRTPVDTPGADELRCAEVDKSATNSPAPILGRERIGTSSPHRYRPRVVGVEARQHSDDRCVFAGEFLLDPCR